MEDPFPDTTSTTQESCCADGAEPAGTSEGEPKSTDTSMECDSSNVLVDRANVYRTFSSPDAVFFKRMISPGLGFTAPNDGATCHVTILCWESSMSDAEPNIGYPCEPEADIILGDGCGVFSEGIDACLETMHEGEECELIIFSRNRDEANSRNDDECKWNEAKAREATGICKDDGSAKYWIGSLYVGLHHFTRNKDIFEMSVADILLRVNQLKEYGTKCFKGGKQQLAEKFYIRALRYMIAVCHPKDVKDLDDKEREEYHALKRTCSLNLAACQLKHKRYSDVIIHCSYALETDPANIKALYRRCQAYLALDEFESARADINLALSTDPKNKAVLEQQRLLIKREKQVYNKLSKAMNKMFGGSA